MADLKRKAEEPIPDAPGPRAPPFSDAAAPALDDVYAYGTFQPGDLDLDDSGLLDGYSDSEDDDDAKPPPKPVSKSISLGTYTAGPVDPHVGQRAAFPGLDDPSDALTLDYDGDGSAEPLDGMAYLRQVREEARARPSFVSVEAEPASPPEAPAAPAEPTGDRRIDAQWHAGFMACYRRLRAQFEETACLVDPPTAEAVAALPNSLATWREFVLAPENEPTVSLVAALQQEMLFRLLKYFQKWVCPTMSLELSRWVFALLVRIPDVITSDEISILRELSQKCLLVMHSPESSEVALATADTVVSIVADFYSQRDLAFYLF
ncbi:uncharacterized protein V1510DRAFT_418520, partial [Dipodascopsis tothii]|uniref:uncharacterized protein n=1 Tax=Dipodascopsis tothii TaxID=44089 RepID=UPI0034CFD6CD